MSESIGDIVDVALGIRLRIFHHPVRDLAAAHRFLDEFPAAVLSAPMRGRRLCVDPGLCASTVSSDESACCIAG